MNICIKTAAKRQNPQSVVLDLSDRLPVQVVESCHISCAYHVTHCKDYYELNIKTQGNITILCQRCLNAFEYHHEHQTVLAVCATEAVAERYMANLECEVAPDLEIDLSAVVTDDLHLFLPEKHIGECP